MAKKKPSDFSKIINHPEKDSIISRLVSGDPPEMVSEYLKVKYPGKDQVHLRIPITILKEFSQKYLDRYKFMEKLVEDQKNGQISDEISKSLINNKTWRDRVAEFADKEIDLKQKIQQLVIIIEARAEQIFDKLQENPLPSKHDYILIQYLEKLIMACEKADKIVNERPDSVVQHNITVQMVEQQSAFIQEAIRDVLQEMDPEFSAKFLERLSARLQNMDTSASVKVKPLQFNKDVKRLLDSSEAEFEDDND